jgi:hypothetical protein
MDKALLLLGEFSFDLELVADDFLVGAFCWVFNVLLGIAVIFSPHVEQ